MVKIIELPDFSKMAKANAELRKKLAKLEEDNKKMSVSINLFSSQLNKIKNELENAKKKAEKEEEDRRRKKERGERRRKKKEGEKKRKKD